MRIELVDISKSEKTSNAFGVSDEEDKALRNEILRIEEKTETWTELLRTVMAETDTELVTLYKMLLVGQLMGTRIVVDEVMK